MDKNVAVHERTVVNQETNHQQISLICCGKEEQEHKRGRVCLCIMNLMRHHMRHVNMHAMMS